jgi:hypothetical protein
MPLFCLGLRYHVINIAFDSTMNHIMKQSHHGSLLHGTGILETEWHHLQQQVPHGAMNIVFFISSGDLSI